MRRFSWICLLTLFVPALPVVGWANEAPLPKDHWIVVKEPGSSLHFLFGKGSRLWGGMRLMGTRVPWEWGPPSAQGYGHDGALDVSVPFVTQVKTADKPQQAINIRMRMEKTGPNAVTLTYTLSADGDRMAASLYQDYYMLDGAGGTLVAYGADGAKTKQTPLPVSMGAWGAAPAAKMDWKLRALGTVRLALDPPYEPWTDGNSLRLPFLLNPSWAPTPEKGLFRAGTKTYTVTYTFPGPVDFYCTREQMARLTRPWADETWYPLSYKNAPGRSVIGMEDWLEAPAGKHGHLLPSGDHFAFQDGTPMKLWGVNMEGPQCYPGQNTDAESAAAHLAKYGVNCVRFGQFLGGWGGFDLPDDCTAFDPKRLDRFDYFCARLKAHGIYYGWLHTWLNTVKPAQKDKLLAYDEIQKNLGGRMLGIIQVAPDVQDVMIATVTNLLKHKNPYTGLTYAEDPALCFLEGINENDIFFFDLANVEKCPTYKKRLEQNFAAWLKERYGSAAAWKKAWAGAARKEEGLDGQVRLQTNPWFMGSDGLAQVANNPGARRRLLDNAAFFHHLENAFYSKFRAAMRAAGFKGPIEGSNWLSMTMVPHLYNLKSDAATGWVDRHNYFGGEGGGMFASMLSSPGSGILSSGLQQVKGAAFGQSEWTSVYPNTYAAECAPLMAAYAMGLQGWQTSFHFQDFSAAWDLATNQQLVGNLPFGVWNMERPSQMGQYPVLSRMLYRGDVKPGDVVSVRRVSDQNLHDGKFDFAEDTQSSGDVKEFKSSVPREALAAGRVLLEFTGEKAMPSTFPKMKAYQPAEEVIRSTTGQLRWDYRGKGFVLINTPGTKGVVGFTPDTPHALGNVTITSKSPFASILVTALDKGKTLADCTHALVSIVSRESNTGFTYSILNDTIVDNGKPPMRMEPVRAGIAIAGRLIAAVNVLDFDGRRQADKTLSVGKDGQFSIDTGKDHTMYYEVLFARPDTARK